MSEQLSRRQLSRRAFLMGGAGAVAAGALGSRGLQHGRGPAPVHLSPRANIAPPLKQMHLAATDGWVHFPTTGVPNAPFFPDALAPSPYNMYAFGFRDVTGLTPAQVTAQRGHAQISAPILAFDEGDEVRITLTNLGLSVRPDLVDGHTIHWHGFVNAIPLFDGVPELSISVPIGRDFTYFYRPHDPGTYMYHCHFEDVEHVQMGMTGIVFVRPAQNQGAGSIPPGKYAYNDGLLPTDPRSTAYAREFTILLTEVWAEAHYRDAHIQATDWTDFQPSFWAMNGRVYPETTQPNGGYDASGNPTPPIPELGYQPNSSLITANTGEKVLVRVSNLGYQNHSLTMDGVDLTVIAKDASQLKGRDGTIDYLTTNTVDIGPGESRDILFTAPDPGTYLLYDRDYAYRNNGGGVGYGGQMTEVRVSASGVPPQTKPNF